MLPTLGMNPGIEEHDRNDWEECKINNDFPTTSVSEKLEMQKAH